ncbi:MAG: NgoBV family restriction endonuclease [Kiritimatiellae bacterium]|nr:NgoBV family restriction endonuclease [Kiritimatiellia bacterium]
MKKTITAKSVYDTLIDEDKILTLKGRIQFHLGDVDIIVKQKDVVGNIIQEWLQGWLDKRGYAYRTNPNTQMPPDFFLDSRKDDRNLLEVKAFNREATPAFDIADFRMYAEEIVEKPWMLDVDYLIFGYHMEDDGIVTVKDLWLKKVWQITRRMEKWPLNLQIKSNVIHKIRPGVWYGKPTQFRMFDSLESFVSAVDYTVWQNPKTRETSGTWLVDFQNAYARHYGRKITIPRWTEIADKYLLK